MDALNEDKIAELKKYHEETESLIKYYYMDIPRISTYPSKHLTTSRSQNSSGLTGVNTSLTAIRNSRLNTRARIKVRNG